MRHERLVQMLRNFARKFFDGMDFLLAFCVTLVCVACCWSLYKLWNALCRVLAFCAMVAGTACYWLICGIRSGYQWLRDHNVSHGKKRPYWQPKPSLR